MQGISSSQVDDPHAFNHRFAEVNGIRMHFVDEGKGPLVILLHGFPFLWYLWRHQIRALAAAGYRVVAPERSSTGLSRSNPLSFCPRPATAAHIHLERKVRDDTQTR
jgi:pimeloyl-ACP methyl ester carboxylesterase